MDPSMREAWARSGHAMFDEFMGRVETIDRVGVKGLNESSTEKRITLLDTRRILGTLEEIADLYLSEDKKMVLDFTDSKVVQALQSPTPETPMEYVGLRWSYYRSPSRLVKSQDFFYLETMKPFVDPRGRRGWAKCSHSVEHAMCPPSGGGVNRGRLYYSGVIFNETSTTGLLEATFYYTLDTTSIPAFLFPMVMKARGKNNAELINHYAKLARMTHAGRDNSTARRLKQKLMDEKRCGACSNRMPKLSIRAKCQFCRSYVCKRCTSIIAKSFLFDGSENAPACMMCAEKHGTKLTAIMNDGNSSESSSTHDRERSNTNSRPPLTPGQTWSRGRPPSSTRSPPATHERRPRSASRTVAPTSRHGGGFQRNDQVPLRHHSVDRQRHCSQRQVEPIRHAQAMRRHGSMDSLVEPAYTRENPCDLSYLSAFKV